MYLDGDSNEENISYGYLSAGKWSWPLTSI